MGLEQFDLDNVVNRLAEAPLDSETIDSIAEFVGGNAKHILGIQRIIPYFSLFNGIYLRSISKNENYIHEKIKTDGNGKKYASIWIGKDVNNDGTKWAVTEEDFINEYRQFKATIGGKLGIGGKELNDWLDKRKLGKETSERFWKYLSGKEVELGPISGTCAWPLGCVQNLKSDEFKNSYKLGNEKEHSRPKTLYEYSADQSMCHYHNMIKTDNPIFDLGGVLNCIYAKEEVAKITPISSNLEVDIAGGNINIGKKIGAAWLLMAGLSGLLYLCLAIF